MWWLNAVLYVALAWVIICGLITFPFFGRLAYIAIRNRWRARGDRIGR